MNPPFHILSCCNRHILSCCNRLVSIVYSRTACHPGATGRKDIQSGLERMERGRGHTHPTEDCGTEVEGEDQHAQRRGEAYATKSY